MGPHTQYLVILPAGCPNSGSDKPKDEGHSGIDQDITRESGDDSLVMVLIGWPHCDDHKDEGRKHTRLK